MQSTLGGHADSGAQGEKSNRMWARSDLNARLKKKKTRARYWGAVERGRKGRNRSEKDHELERQGNVQKRLKSVAVIFGKDAKTTGKSRVKFALQTRLQDEEKWHSNVMRETRFVPTKKKGGKGIERRGKHKTGNKSLAF